MNRQFYAAHTVVSHNDAKTRPHPNPSIKEHVQFLPGDRATQILLQQFV